MGTSLSTILDPANQLIELLFTPKLIYFCAFFAFEGLKNGITLTHAGMKKGVIARIYGVFYLIVCLGNLLTFPYELRNFLSIDPAKIKQALLFADSIPPLGFIFIGLGMFLLLFAEGLFRYGKKKSRASRKIHRIRLARNWINWMAALPFALGIQALIGLPQWVYVGIFFFFMYFAPFTSPKEIMKTMRFQNEKHPNVKSVSTTENVG